ncbi:hypothetical protein MKK88_10280 [Methylobacterium sp. E-005]|uniref:hypothetical protein n=1 Tax=Methylobacterium sp. E-005 TaxID=2836549 RepID=UPI001FBA736A|nr:hypothetical protein [Methylobacterium sp. E-005]MCJ2086377.1 hypothetical protein [Methylobacterium sp. E-005]
MTALSPDLSARVAKLLPRLGTDQQGEVAAVAAALTRVLHSGGCDLHDLAKHVAEGPREVVRFIREPQEPPRAGPRDYGDWRKTWAGCDPRRQHKARVDLLTSDQTGFLTDWEFTFARSLSRQLAEGRPLSPKQTTILGEIYARWTEARG